MFQPLARAALAAILGPALAGCIVVVPVATGPVVLGHAYPNHPAPGPAPASANCPRPVRAAAAQAEVLSRINAERRAKGLATLRASARLSRVAQAHACDNAPRRSISHTGSDGSDLGQRLRREGYQFATAAENTGLGFDSPTRAMALWMASSGHRSNILNPSVTELGVGMADGPRPAWVLVMARPR